MSMEKKCVLPVTMQEEVNNFMTNSLYLCILFTKQNMWDWYYEHYVQIFYIKNKAGRYSTQREMWMDFYGGATYPREFFETRDYRRSEMEEKDFMEFFKQQILEGKYIYTFIDESYLGGTNHNAHDFLLYGYDDEEECFHCICFYDKKFQMTKIKYDVFKKSYQDAMDISGKFDRYGGVGYVETLHLKNDSELAYTFNMENYKKRLQEYIDSVNCGQLYAVNERHHRIYEKFESWYGISAYEAFVEVITEIKDEAENLDYRPFQTIYEHQKAMLKRWNYFYEKGFITQEAHDELADLLEEQVKRAENMRFLGYRYHLQRRRTFLEEIIGALKSVEEDNRKIVNRQLEILAEKGE